jgi:signal transduction histidine kinase
VSFLFLLGIPLAYGYAILRYRLIEIERYVNRAIVYGLLIILVSSFFTFSYLGIQKLFLSTTLKKIETPGLVILALLTIFVHPLYNFLQQGIDRILYGGWYDNAQVIQQVSHSLDLVQGDEQNIAFVFCQAIQEIFQVEYVNIILQDSTIVTSHNDQRSATQSADPEDMILFIHGINPTGKFAIGRFRDLDTIKHLRQKVTSQTIGKRPDTWICLSSNREFLALIILGRRRGGGEIPFSKLKLLDIIARQAKIAFENAHLLKTVQERSSQMTQAHRQIVHAREEERKRLARNLHDNVIQSLVGLNYKLSGISRQISIPSRDSLLGIQKEIKNSIGDIRQICSELRPPALDNMGLISAIQSRIDEVKEQFKISVHFQTLDPNVTVVQSKAEM